MTQIKMTSIWISESIKERLDSLKNYKRETYQDVLETILNQTSPKVSEGVNQCKERIKREKVKYNETTN